MYIYIYRGEPQVGGQSTRVEATCKCAAYNDAEGI